MNNIINALALLLIPCLLSGQQYPQKGLDWEFKSMIYAGSGATYWETDLGGVVGMNGQVGYKILADGSDTPILVDFRALYSGFYAQDERDRISRQFGGGSLGFGMHVRKIVFGQVNVGYLKTIGGTEAEKALNRGTFFGSFKGIVRVPMGRGWAIMLEGEAGRTSQDVDFTYREGSRYNWTPFLRVDIGVSKTLNIIDGIDEEKARLERRTSRKNGEKIMY